MLRQKHSYYKYLVKNIQVELLVSIMLFCKVSVSDGDEQNF
jgi:hypothetical protein